MIDTANCVADVLYRLGLISAGDLTSNTAYVSGNELYQFADDLVKMLAYQVGLFITFDTSINVNPSGTQVPPGSAVYSLPATHVFTLAAMLGNTLLRITAVRELWALDNNWPATTGNAQRVSMDAGSIGTITIYPNPVQGGVLQQVCQEYPATISSGASTVQLPTVFQGMITDSMLKGARGKESDSRMFEVAEHMDQKLKLYQAVAAHLYGPGH